jgi:hypothetical protein
MKTRILSACAMFGVLLIASAASADYVVYDDFGAATLDMSRWSLAEGGSAPTLDGSIATFDSASGTKDILSSTAYGYGSYKFKLGATAPGSYSIIGLDNAGSGLYVRNDNHYPATEWDFHVGSIKNSIIAPAAGDELEIVWSASSAQLWKNGDLLVTQTTNLPTVTSANLKLTAYFGGAMTVDTVSTNPVPEPSAIILIATGLIGLLAYAWRKRR